MGKHIYWHVLRVFVIGGAWMGTALAFAPPDNAVKPRFDSRLPGSVAAQGGFVLRTPTAAQVAEAKALADNLPRLVLRWDGLSGSPGWIAAPAGGSLASAAGLQPAGAAKAFLSDHAAILGLTQGEIDALALSSVVVAREGDAHVHLTQTSGGLDVFQSGADINIDANGSILSAGTHLYASISVSDLAPAVKALDAFTIAQRDVYPGIPIDDVVASAKMDGDRLTTVDGAGFAYPPEARLMIFPTADGARLAWEVRIAEPTRETDYRLLIDARDGALLYRENHTVYATAKVLQANYPDPQSEEIAPPQFGTVTIPSSTPESPQGWITGAGTSLAGNNADARLQYFTGSVLAEPSASYEYDYGTPREAVTNAWWWVNDAHDRFYALGFDEAAGNLQTDNFGNGGIGGDAIRVSHFILGGRNNAFNDTYADGAFAGVSFFWTDCRACGDHDTLPETGGERSAGNMRDVVVHEYGHSVSTRMVGGPAVIDCLSSIQSGAMGEAWSDVFAGSFGNDGQIGQHFTEGFGWLRDLRQDLTYSDLCHTLDGGCEVHADGFIWGATLWELRKSMIEMDPASGLDKFHRIVIKGLANTACHPDFLDARDAILTADTMLYGSSHHRVIWNEFARRKMGNAASSTGENDTAPVTSTAVPVGMECTTPGTPTALTATPTASNEITLSYSAPLAAAVEVYREELGANDFDAPVQVGSTTSQSSFVDATVQGGKSYRYSIVAVGDGGVTCLSGGSSTSDATATGACTSYPILDPHLSISDGAASCAVTLSWSAASQGCPSSPQGIVYNIYRADFPGYEPSSRLLIGRTTATTLDDIPPQDNFNKSLFYYLVTAQHGSLSDPADHRARGASQVLKWAPRIPTLGRTVVQSWDFDGGAAGWTTDNTPAPTGAWTLATSTPPTRYGEAPFAPNTTAGGSAMSWFTGQGNASIATNDCDGLNKLISPTFDGTGGKTILSFDYWSHAQGRPSGGGIRLEVSNGVTTVTFQDIQARTIQPFDTATDRGWQRGEVDLATLIAPTATMQVRFVSRSSNPLSEFGVDNVVLAQATVCGRPSLRISNVVVDDSQLGWGNGNGTLEAGETARLLITLTNDGGAAATGATGVLIPVSLGLTSYDPQDTFPTIAAAGGTGVSSGQGFTITLASGAPSCGSTLLVDLATTDASGTVSRGNMVLETGRTQGTVAFEDTFATNKGWQAAGNVGKGVWQRGDPVGTLDGGIQANPELDSPNDPDSFCFVTENGPIGGAAGANDLDAGVFTFINSPAFDLTAYKRATVSYDLWYYDSSSARPNEDFGETQVYIDDGVENWFNFRDQFGTTGGWQPVSFALSIPFVSNTRFFAFAVDQGVDDVVEMGVDNVKVTGFAQVCDPFAVTLSPNNITTLHLAKSGRVDFSWTPPPIDGTHHGASHYQLWVSSIPSGGFAPAQSTATTQTSTALTQVNEYYSVISVNAAGSTSALPTP